MQTNPIANSTLGTARTTTSTSAPSSELDKNGFLKLLTEQLRNQDPNSSNDPTQYFQQISMMTMVEQLTNIATLATSEAKQTAAGRAEALLGRTVTYKNSDGVSVTGAVDRVDLSGDKPKLTVAGIDGIDPNTLTEVR
jgi:flagellar basal-body rod modification protein FlgD